MAEQIGHDRFNTVPHLTSIIGKVSIWVSYDYGVDLKREIEQLVPGIDHCLRRGTGNIVDRRAVTLDDHRVVMARENLDTSSCRETTRNARQLSSARLHGPIEKRKQLG